MQDLKTFVVDDLIRSLRAHEDEMAAKKPRNDSDLKRKEIALIFPRH